MPVKPKVCHYTDVPAQIYGEQAPGTSVRWLIDEPHDGAPTYALRMIEVAPGGHTPRHTHPWEHENFVVSGTGRVSIGGEWYDLKPGDVVLVPSGVEHTYENNGDESFNFLCGIPVQSKLPQER
jgi:quercetin dioxygenase-like cupin family protein